MFNIDIDGNEFILGALALSLGMKRIARPKEENKAFSLFIGAVGVMFGVCAVTESVRTWIGEPKEEDDWDEEEC